MMQLSENKWISIIDMTKQTIELKTFPQGLRSVATIR
jgi:hypothetical protein